jgi:hypothetical protein
MAWSAETAETGFHLVVPIEAGQITAQAGPEGLMRSRPLAWCKSAGHGLKPLMARAARHAAAMRRGRACGSSLN